MRNRQSLILSWIMHNVRAARAAWAETFSTPVASLVTALVIGIAMALPLGLSVLLQNSSAASDNIKSQPTLSIYLSKAGNADAARQSLIERLRAMPVIASVKYISPEQGLTEFQAQTKSAEWIKTLNNNPLPGVLIVTPNVPAQDIAALQSLQNRIGSYAGVDLVQLDARWLERFGHILTIGQRLSLALAILFGMAVILTTANTIRLTTQHHQQEMQVLRLIGASRAFIRRPLLYRGAIYGLFGSVIALLLVFLLTIWLQSPISALAKSYQHIFRLQAFSAVVALQVLIAGCALGVLGAGLALTRHLRSEEWI